ncbi:MAG: glycogen debranching enzyme family protein [Sedimentisphaerales bacterium]|nr:glycogen debranching enzyme family protein [Sedimentisphaerales bacterium]
MDKLTISVDEVGNLLEKEWLLSNERGSYASGTVIGCNTRRYHGLLVASLHPPVERVVTLSNVLDTVEYKGVVYDLASFEFSDRLHPQGYRYLREFGQDTGVHFWYEINGVKIEKAIYLAHQEDVVLICYDIEGAVGEAVELTLKPLLAMRDFHDLQHSSVTLQMNDEGGVVTVGVLDPNGPAVHMRCDGVRFDRGPDWWYAMRYREETRRGQNDYEDVWSAGAFTAQVIGSGRVVFAVQATRGLERPGLMDFDVEELVEDLRGYNKGLVERAGARDDLEVKLVKAADQVVVRREIGRGKESASILAGYHWFADWGRDTFISLPGILLETGREAEAKEVLETFGAVIDGGMIPNRFDDYGGEPHYNSVDASLWYVNAAYEYLLCTGDRASFDGIFRPKLAEILAAYEAGTRDIRGDSDGLIIAGNAETQLTWMDAKCNGVVFTPRYGKPVEVEALWINGLNIMAETSKDEAEKEKYLAKAKKAAKSFKKLFWNEENECLNDCVLPDGTVDAAIRPNQIFAVSLPFSCLTLKQQKAVVAVVKDELLTPYGLRSLSPRDSRYQGHYRGDQFERDSAYHQGTVWAFLMEPFVTAHLKVRKYSKPALREAGKMIEPLLRHLEEDGCLGSVSEIFDGDLPHRPVGCVAQAWSIGALLRCKRMCGG